jgi:hypothetical protein
LGLKEGVALKQIGGNSQIKLIDISEANVKSNSMFERHYNFEPCAAEGFGGGHISVDYRFEQKGYWGLESELAQTAGLGILYEMSRDSLGNKGVPFLPQSFLAKNGDKYGTATEQSLSTFQGVPLSLYAAIHPDLKKERLRWNDELFYSDRRDLLTAKLSRFEGNLTSETMNSLINHYLKSGLLLNRDFSMTGLDGVELIPMWGEAVRAHNTLSSALKSPIFTGDVKCFDDRVESIHPLQEGIAQNIEWAKYARPKATKQFFGALESHRDDIMARINFSGLEEYVMGKDPSKYPTQSEATTFLTGFEDLYKENFTRQAEIMEKIYHGKG